MHLPASHSAAHRPRLLVERRSADSARYVLGTGFLLWAAGFTWVHTEVAALEAGALAPELLMGRVVPVSLALMTLALEDLRRGMAPFRHLFSWPAGALAWYAIVAAIAGGSSRAPSLALWKSLELLTVAYWGAHVAYHAILGSDSFVALKGLLKCTGFFVFYLLLAALANPAEGFRHSGSGLPWLQGYLPLVNANTAGVIALLFGYALFTGLIRFRFRMTTSLLAVASIAAFVLAQSRTAYVAGLVLLVATGFHASRNRERASALRVGLTCLVLAGGLMAHDPVMRVFQRGQTAEEVTELSGRTDYWDVGIRSWADSPWIGSGIATGSRFLYEDYRDVFRKGSVNMHNSFIEALLSGGLLGAIPLFGILAYVLVKGIAPGAGGRPGVLLPAGGIAIVLLLRANTSIAAFSFSTEILVLMAVAAGARASSSSDQRA